MSTAFPAKASPSEQKLRGGYYTPDPISRFVSEWVSEAGPRTLEPSAGDGAILKYLAMLSQPTAIEIVRGEAELAQKNAGVNVINADFFDWFSEDKQSSYDAVAGNPPYIRFGNWPPKERDKALAFMKSAGLNPSRLTNAWLPFVVASVLAVRDKGRIGLVLPAELLQVDYARELRAFLEDKCSHIHLLSFKQLVFPAVQQEVVLLLAERGSGKAEIHAVEIHSIDDLAKVEISTGSPATPLHPGEKWTQFYLSADQIQSLRNLADKQGVMSIGDFAKVNVGVVTGRNSFFCLSEAEAIARDLNEFTMPLVSRSNFLRSTNFHTEDFDTVSENSKTRLLAISSNFDLNDSTALREYVELGEEENVHTGYKCRIRKPWWSVPSTQEPDGFMLRQISKTLLLSANHAGATSTDTVHRVFMQSHEATIDQLSVASLSTLSAFSAEVAGRSYGGGVLELEPREAQKVLIPDPRLVPGSLVNKVDFHMRNGEEEKARNLVDKELLLEKVGISKETLSRVSAAHNTLMNRRLSRGRSRKKTTSKL